MESTFKFKFRKASWGIFVDLTAEFVPCDLTLLDSHDKDILPVTENLWLHLKLGNLRLPEEEKPMLVLGAQIILNVSVNPIPTTPGIIKISELSYPLTEYQPEGFAYAIAGWIAQEWNVPMPEIYIRYEKAKNTYFFKFPGLPEMGSYLQNGLDWTRWNDPD